VTGNPPFYSRDVDKIYYSIQNEEIDFPPHIDLSQEIKMLLEGLLMKDPKRRLGSMGGVREILGHPWVRKLKPADIINKSVPTPVRIDLLTFNINEEEIEEGGEVFYDKFADEDHDFEPEFEDFYFNRYE
jgi:serine/threonine protein kinase